MLIRSKVILGLMGCFCAPVSVMAASFDCSHIDQLTLREQYICQHPTVSKMDELLNVVYQRTYKAARDPSVVKRQQVSWWHNSMEVCQSEQSVKECEATYLAAIQRLQRQYYGDQKPLISAPTPIQKALISGMTFPKNDELDKTSRTAVIDNEQYQPWARRPILDFPEHQSIVGLTAIYKDDTLYIYYALDAKADSGLYEFNMKTAQTRLIYHHSDWWSDWSQPLQVKDNTLFFTPDGSHFSPNVSEVDADASGVPMMMYSVGSGMSPNVMSAQQFQRYHSILDIGNSYATTEDGQWTAAYIGALFQPNSAYYEHYNKLDGLLNSYDVRAQTASVSRFMVYHGSDQTVYDPLIDGDDLRWNISGLVFDRHNPYVYFANHGAVACIWRFDIKANTLTKIVPEHDSKLPAPVMIEGHEFLAFVMKNKEGRPSIYLAVRSE